MRSILPPQLDVHYTSDWDGPMDGASIAEGDLEGYGLFPTWQIESDNEFWRRPLKLGEIGCAVSHWLCWQRSLESSDHLFLYLEDDVELADGFLVKLNDILARLTAFDPQWDLLYLGRHSKAPDQPALPGIVRPGYSWCAHGYMLTRRGVEKVVGTRFDRDLMPVDEFLPALYVDHEREGIRQRYPKVLNAYAVDPSLVIDLPRSIWGTDTEDSAFIGR